MAKLKFTKFFVCILLSFGVSNTLQAQDRVLPGSDGAALVQSINVPTNLYTGTANIEVPLCTLETLGGPAINIGLYYQASGIKVEDRETNVGLGWQLTGVGKVTRVVRGRPDELGYRHASSNTSHGEWMSIQNEVLLQKQIYESLYSYKDIIQHGSQMEIIVANVLNGQLDIASGFDGEPDVYYFQTPTCSGTFVIDYNGEVCLMPYQDIIINIPSSTTGYFEITDMSGINYRLGSTSYSREIKTCTPYNQNGTANDNEAFSYVSSWNLDQIIVNNKTVANFEYPVSHSTTIYYEESKIDNYRATTTFDYTVESVISKMRYEESRERYPSLITTDYGSILLVGRPLVNWIQMQKGSEQDYFQNYMLDYISLNDGREVLDEITVRYGMSSPAKRLVKFDYHNFNVPANYNKYFDDWGYFNWESTYKTRYERLPGHTFDYLFQSYDRTPKIQYATHGALKRITYPTGGHKEFQYEPHLNSDTKSITGGLRIKSITKYDPYTQLTDTIKYYYITRVVSFDKPQHFIYTGANSGYGYYSVYEKAVNTSRDFSGTSSVYSKVKEVFPNGGYKEYSFYSPIDSPDSQGQEKWYANDNINGNWHNNDDYAVPNTSYFYKQGMLSGVAEYKADGEKISHTTYLYDLSQPIRKTVKANVLHLEVVLKFSYLIV